MAPGESRISLSVRPITGIGVTCVSCDTSKGAIGWLFRSRSSLSGAGLYLGETGHDWLAGVLFLSTVGAVITALVVDKRGRLPGRSVPPPADG